MRPGIGELLVIFAIIMLLFGARRLPALADGMGKAIRNFKKGLNTDEDVTPPPTTTTAKQVGEGGSAPDLSATSTEAQPVKRGDVS